MPDGYGQANCIIRIAGITHKSLSPIFDTAENNIISPPEWNDAHSLSGGTNGQFVIRDTSQSSGLNYTTGLAVTTLSPTSDTYIDSQSATTNNDTATDLVLGGDWADTTFARAILMTFDTSALSGKTVYRAQLRLYRTSTNANATQAGALLQAKRILRAYVANQVTWNVYSTGNNWTTAGARSNGNDQATIRHGNIPHGATATDVDLWIEIPMTTLLVESLNASETTFRIKIHQNETDTGQNATSWASINHGTAALRPILVIEYSP